MGSPLEDRVVRRKAGVSVERNEISSCWQSVSYSVKYTDEVDTQSEAQV